MIPEIEGVPLTPYTAEILVDRLLDLIGGRKFFMDHIEEDIVNGKIIYRTIDNQYTSIEYGTRHPLYYHSISGTEGYIYIRTWIRNFHIDISFNKDDVFKVEDQRIQIRYKNARNNDCFLQFTLAVGFLPGD